jgi:hypothetical protein
MYDKISKGRESPNCVYVIRMETLLGDLVQKRKTSFDRDFRAPPAPARESLCQ